MPNHNHIACFKSRVFVIAYFTCFPNTAFAYYAVTRTASDITVLTYAVSSEVTGILYDGMQGL